MRSYQRCPQNVTILSIYFVTCGQEVEGAIGDSKRVQQFVGCWRWCCRGMGEGRGGWHLPLLGGVIEIKQMPEKREATGGMAAKQERMMVMSCYWGGVLVLVD